MQADGKIVIGGDFTAVNGVNVNRLARLNSDGSVDLSFNPGGGANATVRALALDGTSLVVGGDFTGPSFGAAVTNKALSGNVATLTTATAHNLVVNDVVTVSGVDATFDGTYTVASVPTATTFTYARTAADVAGTAVSPLGIAGNAARPQTGSPD